MTEDVQSVTNRLQPQVIDYSLPWFKIFGSLVLLGPVAEAVATFLPGQRVDRIADFCADVDQRLRLQADLLAELERRINDGQAPEACALFEASLSASARATSRERIERYSQIASEGLLGGELAAIESQRALRVLSQIDDAEFQALLTIHRAGGNIDFEHLASEVDVDTQPGPTFAPTKQRERRMLPSSLAAWNTDQLLLSLLHLESLGMIDEVSSKVAYGQKTRCFVLTRAGLLVLRAALGEDGIRV